MDGLQGRLLRVGAAQYGVGTDVEANLERCVLAISEAAAAGVHVLVTPEFSNHAAWFDSQEHAWSVAVHLDGEYLAKVAKVVSKHPMYLQCNIGRRSSNEPGTPLYASNVLIGPNGIIAVSDKTVLMGNENTYFQRGMQANPVVDLPFGRVGMYACMEGVICEPARHLAVRGAQLLLNSLNSFASDEASLHIPVRAAENGVFVVAACKVGPLVPPDQLESVATALQIPPSQLRGAGESQIVGPDGTVLAIGPRDGDSLVTFDIDLSDARTFLRPDGTDIWTTRRTDLYQALAEDPELDPQMPMGDDRVEVAIVSPAPGGPLSYRAGLTNAIRTAASNGARLIVLPELCGQDPYSAEVVDWAELIRALSDGLDHFTEGHVHVVSSIVDQRSHVGVVISKAGIIHRQLQVHRARRLHWMTRLGNSLATVDLPWGRLGLCVGDDLAYPETSRVFATLGAQVLACPISLQAEWETTFGLAERCAENRVNIVAAAGSTGAICSLPTGMTLWAERPERPFDGTINVPDMTWVVDGASVTTGYVRPANAANKLVSRGTNLVAGRPHTAMGPLVDPLFATSLGRAGFSSQAV